MGADTKARILSAAESQFGEHGFAGTRLASIADSAGLGNAGLLHHFPSKAELYRGVLEAIAEDLDGRIRAPAGSPPIDRLRHLASGLVSLHRHRPGALAMITHEFLDRTGRISGAGALPLSGVVAETVDAIESGQRDGSVRAGDPLAMTAALHGALLIGLLGRAVYERTAPSDVPDVTIGDWEAELIDTALAAVASGEDGRRRNGSVGA